MIGSAVGLILADGLAGALVTGLATGLTGGRADRIVNLVTGAPAAQEGDGSWWWRALLIAIGLGAAAGVVAIAVWRQRTSDFDCEERAFAELARRRGLSAGARDEVRRAAALCECAPVALLLSRQEMTDALARLGEPRQGASAV